MPKGKMGSKGLAQAFSREVLGVQVHLEDGKLGKSANLKTNRNPHRSPFAQAIKFFKTTSL